LVLQRLDPEKDTLTAIQAWQAAGLAREGWSLRIVGDGIERKMLEKRVLHDEIVGVVFTGWTDDVPDEFARAGLLLATAPAEPLGLAVLEAMAAGVPIAAAGSGGHLETVGLIQSAQLFEARDPESAANALRSLASDSTRAQLSRAGRELVKARFGLRLHVDRLLAHYIAVCEQDAATKHAA
jgi:glycosyltransferase involved in cell wall biosynthesis